MAQLPPNEATLAPQQRSTEPVAVLVELQGTAASRVYGDTFSREKPRSNIGVARSAAATAARSQIARNKQEHASFKAALSTSGIRADEIYRATKAVNGIALSVSESDIDALRNLPGVKAVTVIEQETPTMSTTVPFLGVPAVWSGSFPLGLTGDGVRIGIIDSGVDYQHAMFG
ncbi:MAG: protease inhibitor I9 family protein, partial [Casimicrobium sp.]